MLVEKHGFNIVAVEADWPDAAVYDAYVRGLPRPKVPKAAFTRFPAWMRRNSEVTAFLKRLKAINAGIGDPERRCGFYGLDVHSLSASIEHVLLYLDKVDPESARIARERYGCLAPWRADPVRYGRMALSRGYAVCEKPVADAASSTGPRRSCCRIIPRRNCRASSTPGSGSPRPGPWRRTRKPIRTAPTRPTPSGCSNIHSHSARTQKHSFTSGRLQ
jgi:erythromycin esterase-like protein